MGKTVRIRERDAQDYYRREEFTFRPLTEGERVLVWQNLAGHHELTLGDTVPAQRRQVYNNRGADFVSLGTIVSVRGTWVQVELDGAV